jgi:glycine/D-amino acid oxidase-like deaminating enzyme
VEFERMTQHYDVIVIGGGHNGLTNAAYLAKAGKKVLVLERRMFVRGVTATARDYPRLGSATAWAGNFAAGWNVHPDAQRRLFVADERSRADGTRNTAALASGCGGVRRIFEDNDADVPVREANLVDDPAGPDDAAAERLEAATFSDATIPRSVER